MRLTVRIKQDGALPARTFAVLWLDTERRVWSREAHHGIDLPDWGTLESFGGAVALQSADDHQTVCRLEGLSFANLSPGHKQGQADLAACQTHGAWQVQAVDESSIAPEHAEFPCAH
jgi:hypothetical protein